MIVVLGWATVLAVVFLIFLAGLPDYVKRIDADLEKHRKPVERQRHLRRIK
jgi:hypothetical protein